MILDPKPTTHNPTHTQFQALQPVVVKGRDAPLNVHKALKVLANSEIRDKVLNLVKTHHQVQKLPPALENYFFCLLSKGINGCSSAFIINVCNNLLENGHIHHNPDHTLVSKQNLLGLDNGQTSMQALARGDFESLSLQIHVQMLVKVLCTHTNTQTHKHENLSLPLIIYIHIIYMYIYTHSQDICINVYRE
jgi:hypothetical protein